MLEQSVIHGARHAWSGGRKPGSYTRTRAVERPSEPICRYIRTEAMTVKLAPPARTEHIVRKPFLEVLKAAFGAWLDDRAPTLAGALSFSTIFALAPLLVIIMEITGFFVNSDQIQQHLINQASHSVGSESAIALQAMVKASRANVKTSAFFGVIGWLTLVGAASGVFLTLQDALNIVWHVEVKKNEPLLKVIRERAGALLMVFVMAFLLILTFAGDATIAVVVTFLSNNSLVAQFAWLLQLASTIASLAIATVLFALAFKVLPQVQLLWRNVWEGALVSAVLFVAGQWAIALLLKIAGLTNGYGAAGSVLALLMWIYVSSMFLFFGAEVVKYRSLEDHVSNSGTGRPR
jgi:membrane protein